MNREQLWAQYAAAALSGILANEYSNNQQAMAVDADTAGNYADAMLAEHLSRFPQDQQEAQQPDADGWIKWEGGECPVGKGVLVDIAIRSGVVCTELDAGKLRWLHADGSSLDIIAYRLSC